MGNRGTRPQSQFDAKAVFEACVEHDVAVEINARPERRDPPTKLLELARDIGCLFSIDSDAHAPGQLDFQVYGCERAEAGRHRRRSDRQHVAAGAPAGLGEPDSFSAMPTRPEVEVRRSKRRRRTVSAYRDGDRVVVLIPASLCPQGGGRVGRDDARPARALRAAAQAQGGEQHVGHVHVGIGQGVEQRALAGVGVPDQGDVTTSLRSRWRAAVARWRFTSSSSALTFLILLADEAPVGLELALAGTARADPAAGARQVGPQPGQARQVVLERRQLDLEASLLASSRGARRCR